MAHLEDRWAGDRQGTGLRWRVRWRDVSGRARAKSFARKDDATRYLHDVAGQLDRGDYLDSRRGLVPFGEVADEWWRIHSPKIRPSTADRYRQILETRVSRQFRTVPVAAIDYAMLEDWVTDLSAELAGSTVRQHLVVVSEVLDHAIRTGRIRTNPARLVRKPPTTPLRRHRYLDAGQLDLLADATGRYRPLVLTLGYCGLRWGELAALQPGDVDEVRGRLIVDQGVTRIRGTELHYDAPKDHEPREVPVPDFVLDEIRTLEPAGGLLFTTTRGRPLHSTNFRRQVWLPALERAGLPELRIHELRHTAASLAVASGADVLAVARMLGHSSPARTLKVYADLFDTELDDLRRRMDTTARRARAARGDVVDLRTWRAVTD